MESGQPAGPPTWSGCRPGPGRSPAGGPPEICDLEATGTRPTCCVRWAQAISLRVFRSRAPTSAVQTQPMERAVWGQALSAVLLGCAPFPRFWKALCCPLVGRPGVGHPSPGDQRMDGWMELPAPPSPRGLRGLLPLLGTRRATARTEPGLCPTSRPLSRPRFPLLLNDGLRGMRSDCSRGQEFLWGDGRFGVQTEAVVAQNCDAQKCHGIVRFKRLVLCHVSLTSSAK